MYMLLCSGHAANYATTRSNIVVEAGYDSSLSATVLVVGSLSSRASIMAADVLAPPRPRAGAVATRAEGFRTDLLAKQTTLRDCQGARRGSTLAGSCNTAP